MKPQHIVLISLVGFALLTLLGLGWLKDATRPVPAPAAQPTPTEVAPPPAPTPRPLPPVSRPAPARPVKPAPAAPLSPPALNRPDEEPMAPKMTPLRPDWDVKRLHFANRAPTALEALRPLVAECFHDAAHRLRPGDHAVLGFRTAPDGRFEDGKVASSSVQDPYFQACLQDALDDAATTPEGAQGPQRYTFTFAPDGGVEAEPSSAP